MFDQNEEKNDKSQEVNKFDNSQCQVINDSNHEVNSTGEALQFLSNLNFTSEKSENIKLISIKFKITDILDDQLNSRSLSHFFDIAQGVVVVFESSTCEQHSVRIFWKTPLRETFCLLSISEDFDGVVTDFCHNFLTNEIKKGRIGILHSKTRKHEYELREMGCENNRNLLIIAAMMNLDVVVGKLLEYNLDVDKEDKDMHNAIEKAWLNYTNPVDETAKHKSNEIILSLLNKNSKLPSKLVDFQLEKSSSDVQNFVTKCELIHEIVEDGDVEVLRKKLEEVSHLCYIYDSNNNSLMYHALNLKRFDMFQLLSSAGISISSYEIDYLEDVYEQMSQKELCGLRTRHRMASKEFPKSHLLVLRSKSKVGNNDRQMHSHWLHIEKAFKFLNLNEGCMKVLQVAAAWKRTEIFFDFNHDIAYYHDPTSSIDTEAVAYESGIIHFGARNLLDDDKKFPALGVLIHEFCHLAVLFTFMNNFDPFPMGESQYKVRYKNLVVPECEKNGNFEPIVGSVLLYPKNEQDCEFIVRVVQMLMHYYVEDQSLSCENSVKIKERKDEKFPELFKYFEDVVMPEMTKAVPVLKTLQDEGKKIIFEELTEPMRARILHTKILFQGNKTTFYDLIGSDEKILCHLSSNDIKEILIKGTLFKVGTICEKILPYRVIERKFIPLDRMRGTQNIQEFQDIKNQTETSKIFILADLAGTGKTTSFMDMTIKLKRANKNFWVSFIVLRNHGDLFKEFLKRNIEWNVQNVLELLTKMLNLSSTLETEIFRKLFFTNQVIFLFDGVDEICPHFNTVVVNFLKTLKKQTENQLWISTRPQHAPELEGNFNTFAYKFVPYSNSEISENATDILFASGICDRASQLAMIKEVQLFLKSVKTINEVINNPLMIKIILELHIAGEIDIKTDKLDIFEIYGKIEHHHKKKIDQKVEFEDRDPFHKISLEDVHQALALIHFLSHNKSILERLKIIRKWERYEKKFTPEKIQRYGLVSLNLDYKQARNQHHSITFTHRTYAEFFIAKYILNMLFDSFDDVSGEEATAFMELLEYFSNKQNFDNIFNFIYTFLKNDGNSQGLNFGHELREKCRKTIQNIIEKLKFETNDELLGSLRFFSVCFLREPEVLKELWKLDEQRTILHRILLDSNNRDLFSFKFADQLELFFRLLGSDWHEIFNKSDDKLVSDGEIGILDEQSEEFNKNLIKILDFGEKNFNQDELQKFIQSICMSDNVERISLKAAIVILQTLKTIFSDPQKVVEHLKRFISNSCDANVLKFISENLEDILRNDVECIKKVLHDYHPNHEHPIYRCCHFGASEAFTTFSKLYVKYKTSQDELKKLLVAQNFLFRVACHINLKVYPQLINFVKQVFEESTEKFESMIVDSWKEAERERFRYSYFDFLRDENELKKLETFITDLFNEDKEKVSKFISKIFENYQSSFKNLIEPAISSKNIERLNRSLTFCDQHNIQWEKCQNEKIIIEIFHKTICNMTEEIYQDYKNFLVKLFGNNCKILSQCVKTVDFRFKKREEFDFLERFLADFHQNDEKKLKDCVRNVIFSPELTSQGDAMIPTVHPIVYCMDSGNINNFERIIEIYTKYKQSWEEIQEMIEGTGILTLILGNIEAEMYPILIKFIQATFESNKSRLSKCFKHSAVKRLILSKKKFSLLERFLNDIHGDDEISKRECIRNILFYCFKYDSHPIYKCISDNKVERLKRVINLYVNYKNSWQEIINIFMLKRLHKLMFSEMTAETFEVAVDFMKKTFEDNREILVDMINTDLITNDYYFVEHAEKFKFFETFLLDFFESDKDRAVEIIRKCLYQKKSFIMHPFIRTVERNLIDEFVEFQKVYKMYAKSTEDLQDHLIEMKIPKLFFTTYMERDLRESFTKFLVEVFKTNPKSFLTSFDMDCKVKLIADDENFRLFQEFLIQFFNNDECRVEEFTREFLFTRPLPIDSKITVYQVEKIESLYTDYKDSWDELQNLINSFQHILKILYAMAEPAAEVLTKFIAKIFNSNIHKIHDCFFELELTKCISSLKFFEFFYKILNIFFGSDEKQIDDCLQKILFKKYEDMQHPLLYSIENCTEDDFKRVLGLYSKHATSSSDIRNAFKSHHILLRIFSNMSNEVYQEFKKFILTNFENRFGELLECMNGGGGQDILPSDEKFDILEDFLDSFFDGSQKREILRNILFYKHYDSDDHLLIYIDNFLSFERIAKLYKNYANSVEEIQEVFISNQILYQIFSRITEEVHPKFCEFIADTFGSNQEKMLNCFNDNCEFELIQQENAFNLFNDFLSRFFNDQQKREIIRKALFFNYDTDDHPLIQLIISNETEMFKRVTGIYEGYSDSATELQEIFTNRDYFSRLFINLPTDTYLVFKTILMKIFEHDVIKLREYFESTYNMHNLDHEKMNFSHDLLKDLIENFIYADLPDKSEVLKRFFTYNTLAVMKFRDSNDLLI